jgi:ABC-2 type transport system permease protein
MHDLGPELRAAWAIARKNLRILLRYRLNAVNIVLQPVYQTLIPGLLLGATFAVGGQAGGLAETAGTDDIAGFLFLGMVAMTMVGAGFWGVAFEIKREMDAGTLEPSWLTPTRRESFVLGQAIGGLLVAGVTTTIVVAVGFAFFGAEVGGRVVAALPALGVAAIGIVGVGYLVGAIVLRMRDANFFVDAADFIFIGLSGAAFPIVVLPEAVRTISYLLPTTYALDLMRVAALDSRPLLAVPLQWLLLVLTSLAILALGRWAWLRTEHRLRVRGTLGQH